MAQRSRIRPMHVASAAPTQIVQHFVGLRGAKARAIVRLFKATLENWCQLLSANLHHSLYHATVLALLGTRLLMVLILFLVLLVLGHEGRVN